MRFNLALLLIASVALVETQNSISLQAFSWSDCGSGRDTIRVQSLSLEPDPIAIPGNASLAIQATVGQLEESPLPLSLTVKKKVLFVWVTIPCESGSGSCDYPDLCSMLPIPDPCPSAFRAYRIPCSCPIKPGNYAMPLSQTFAFASGSVPAWLESGDYRVEATLRDRSGTELLCLDIAFTLKDNGIVSP